MLLPWGGEIHFFIFLNKFIVKQQSIQVYSVRNVCQRVNFFLFFRCKAENLTVYLVYVWIRAYIYICTIYNDYIKIKYFTLKYDLVFTQSPCSKHCLSIQSKFFYKRTGRNHCNNKQKTIFQHDSKNLMVFLTEIWFWLILRN